MWAGGVAGVRRCGQEYVWAGGVAVRRRRRTVRRGSPVLRRLSDQLIRCRWSQQVAGCGKAVDLSPFVTDCSGQATVSVLGGTPAAHSAGTRLHKVGQEGQLLLVQLLIGTCRWARQHPTGSPISCLQPHESGMPSS